MRRTRTIRTRCGVVVVEMGRVKARRRAEVGKNHVERPPPMKGPALGLLEDLSRMLRGRGTFPRVLFGAEG